MVQDEYNVKWKKSWNDFGCESTWVVAISRTCRSSKQARASKKRKWFHLASTLAPEIIREILGHLHNIMHSHSTSLPVLVGDTTVYIKALKRFKLNANAFLHTGISRSDRAARSRRTPSLGSSDRKPPTHAPVVVRIQSSICAGATVVLAFGSESA
ncbi:hypothetical protein DFH06DRAFT_1123840 [Mycena polygramma]|nr:hypothetical protein DFH06DRAFT_1123840 [Mycena polygramma]